LTGRDGSASASGAFHSVLTPRRPRTARRAVPTSKLTCCCLVAIRQCFAFIGLLVFLSIPVRAADWETNGASRGIALTLGSDHPAGFTRLESSQTGIAFTNSLSPSRGVTNQIYFNGSGVAAGDIDGDGWCDLFFCSLDGTCALYRNLGHWRFEDITQKAGVSCTGLACTGAAFADLEGQGNLDLIVNTIGGGTHIFLNDGHGHFSKGPVLNESRGGMSMALADIDGDGLLDIYIANYRTETLRDQPRTNFRVDYVNGKQVIGAVNGKPTSAPELQGRFTLGASGQVHEHGEPDALYHNDGHGKFSLIPFTNGAFLDEAGKPLNSPPYDWGLSVMMRDLNGDGAPDIYVCNDFQSPDRIWLNDRHGHFRAMPALAMRNTSKFSMGVDVADINRDGYDDILVLDMLSRNHTTMLTRADKFMEATPPGVIDNRPQLTRNTLQLNCGDGTYAEVAYYAGLAATEWAWTAIFLDVDLDGYEDLLVSTGHPRDDNDIDNGLRIERTRRSHKMSIADELALRLNTPSLPSPTLAFRNQGNLKFEEVGAKWGFDQVGIARGMCLADLDNDGDLDVVVNNLNSPAAVYRNETSAPRVAVRLRGTGANTRGIGAKIKLFGGAVPMQSQEMICGGRYLSSDDAMRIFAAGGLTNDMRIEVTWRSGKRSTVEGVRANRLYEISESGATEPPQPKAKDIAPLFEDASHLLGHTHHQQPFDDFERQPLLPNRLSQFGPGIAWADFEGSGHEDLAIAAGRGFPMAVFQNGGASGFKPLTSPSFAQAAASDQTAIIGVPQTDGRNLLLAGVSSYPMSAETDAAVDEFDIHAGTVQDGVAHQNSSTGPLALADLDGAGHLELFVGGRMIPGRYPEPASSELFNYRQGKWVRDETNSAVLEGVGLVSGAVWTDLDGDGFPELVLACEWQPLRIFHNDHGRLIPWDPPVTLSSGVDSGSLPGSRLSDLKGWWNGITAGDFDGDGRMDLVAANWGLNTKYQTSPGHGRRLYYGPWGNGGEIEQLEAYFDPEMNKWVPERDLNSTGKGIPWLREKFALHRQYAEAGIEDILGEHLKEAHVLEVNWLSTTVFLNRGDHFELRTLPVEAQFSPAFGVNVADFDGDGIEDIFLSQNFFAVQSQTSRNDAGRGLLLKGDGHGDFAAVPGSLCGIKVYGEQRGSAVADYDGDGRVDLAVTQNGAETKLFHNLTAKRGLRVRCNAGPANPQGIGAVLRLSFGEKWGPAREIHAGSGYWSQDSPVQVMALPQPASRVQVQWPGGKISTFFSIPTNALEISVDISGTVQIIR
jgi:hypothetical protein